QRIQLDPKQRADAKPWLVIRDWLTTRIKNSMDKLFMKYQTILVVVLICLQACKEETRQPIGGDTGKPLGIAHATVENLPGGARIRYDLPNDKSLLYVKAFY